MISIVENREVDFFSHKHFWAKLGQFKFDLVLYSLHFSDCVSILRWSRIGTAVLTALAAGAWMQWKDISYVNTICPAIILILQALNAGVEFLPYDNRKQELRELIDLLEPIYNEMERDWVSIVRGELTIEQIDGKIYNYQNRRTEIVKNFLKNDAIPHRKILVQKAKTEADCYLSSLR